MVRIKKYRNIFILICFILCINIWITFGGLNINTKHPNVLAESTNNTQIYAEDFETDNIIVVLDEGISERNKVHEKDFFEGVEIESIKDLTWREDNSGRNESFHQILQIYLKKTSKENVINAVNTLSSLEGVKSVEPNYALEIEETPNDVGFVGLWGLQDEYGIKAESAWNITTGSREVRVGIIDTGIAGHADLIANLGTGKDFYNENEATADDMDSHGTHVAGTIGAVGNNALGVVGVNWNVTLVPLQIANGGETFFISDIIEAIEWADGKWGTEEQIDIINYSISGFGSHTTVRTAVEDYNGLFVWAAGNQDADVDERIEEYGSFDLPNLISVGALKSNGDRACLTDWGYDKQGNPQGSNYSSNGTNVNIYAPGDNILSTVPIWVDDTGYAVKSGTSMAAPHVAGVAALLLAKYPDLTASQLKEIILESADIIEITLPNGAKQNVKKLNAYEALKSAPFKFSALSSSEIQIDGLKDNFSDIITIPSTINGKTVISIGEGAFANQAGITKVYLPETVLTIEEDAFIGCSNLEYVEGLGVASIGARAFKNCGNLQTAQFSSSLVTIYAEAFAENEDLK